MRVGGINIHTFVTHRGATASNPLSQGAIEGSYVKNGFALPHMLQDEWEPLPYNFQIPNLRVSTMNSLPPQNLFAPIHPTILRFISARNASESVKKLRSRQK